MCGIAGFCINPEQHVDSGVITDLASSLLLDIEHRGYHATGCAWVDSTERKFKLLKKNIPAHKFIENTGDRLVENASTAILHTRWATQGSPNNNDNNHPITRGTIAVTHNGHISNDTELFKRLNVRRRAQVDSEAVSALLAFTHDNYHPTEVLGAIQGTASLAWFNFIGKQNELHLARVNSSPLWIGQTTQGSLLYASTQEAIRNGAWMLFDELEYEYDMKEGEYMRVVNGRIEEYTTFKRNNTQHFVPASNSAINRENKLRTLVNTSKI
jgi:glucosamine--fructose-6-phosphate aminotransferase (isomerizing)